MQKEAGTAKPGFQLSGTLTVRPVKLTADQRRELLDLMPPGRKQPPAGHDGPTYADKFLTGVEDALTRYDLMPQESTAGGPVVADLEIIRRAAIDLMAKIRSSDPRARTALGCEAVAAAFAPTAYRLSELGHAIAASPLQRDSNGEFGTRSLLSGLWDLANDAANSAEAAKASISVDRNARPERANAARLACEIVASVAIHTGNLPPTVAWFFEAAKCAGQLRGLKINRQTVTNQIKINAPRFAWEQKRDA